MKSMFVKGGIALALAAAFGVNAPVVDAASIVPVQPTVAVVDANHAAIVGANTLLNAFIQQHPKAAITEIAFDGEDGQIKYEVEGKKHQKLNGIRFLFLWQTTIETDTLPLLMV